MKLYYTLVGLLLVLTLAGIVGASWVEARTFNKFTTGPKATLVDALFAELRVEAR